MLATSYSAGSGAAESEGKQKLDGRNLMLEMTQARQYKQIKSEPGNSAPPPSPPLASPQPGAGFFEVTDTLLPLRQNRCQCVSSFFPCSPEAVAPGCGHENVEQL